MWKPYSPSSATGDEGDDDKEHEKDGSGVEDEDKEDGSGVDEGDFDDQGYERGNKEGDWPKSGDVMDLFKSDAVSSFKGLSLKYFSISTCISGILIGFLH